MTTKTVKAPKPPIKTIRINRAKWRTGDESPKATGKGITQLANEEGYRCCLGFIVHQVAKCNITELMDKPDPEELDFCVRGLSERGEIYKLENTKLTKEAIDINDDDQTTPRQKERLLKKLFKGVYNLEFYGEYTKPE